MDEQKYYQLHRDKIKADDISTWKYIPIGDSMRKSYDYHYLPLQDFLDRYFSNYDNENWNRWIETIVKPVYYGDAIKWKRINYNNINDKQVFNTWFSGNQKKMQTSFESLKKQYKFNDDILLYISYLDAMGFFKDINTSVDDWLHSKNFNIGGIHKAQEDIYSLVEMSNYKYGEELIKEKLMKLEWLKK